MKKSCLRLAMAQMNPTVGGLEGNAKKILSFVRKARDLECDIVTFPELALCGYPPEDLLLKTGFVSDNLAWLKRIAKESRPAKICGGARDILAVVGFVDRKGEELYNSAALIYNGRVVGVCDKVHLPNYGVFDEKRYFKSAGALSVFSFGKVRFAINICEDIWQGPLPLVQQAKAGAKLILVINASPYHTGKRTLRKRILAELARKNKIYIAYNNLVGGQDELVFDGHSMVIGPDGRIIAQGEPFEEDLIAVDLPLVMGEVESLGGSEKKSALPRRAAKELDYPEEIYKALVLGVRDYVTKNGFKKVVVGLSGGIDSALTAAIAADALGEENVVGTAMPSMYTSQESMDDAAALAENLGIEYEVIPITETFHAYLETLESQFEAAQPNIAEENLQARIRGNILMALSNKFGWLVLTTGNKSEMSVGYATLYGDMAGGLAVIKDVPKTLVYKLSRYRNSLGEAIPERTLTKAPTAELKPDQKDTDTLPPYEELDGILKAYIEEDKGTKEIASRGYEERLVRKVVRMVDKNEYKRRQAPPGIKITPKAFGKDRRMPITNKYKG